MSSEPSPIEPDPKNSPRETRAVTPAAALEEWKSRVGREDSSTVTSIPRSVWESIPLRLAHTDWLRAKAPDYTTLVPAEPRPTVQERLRSLVHRWRSFKHSGYASPKSSIRGFTARAINRTFLLSLSAARQIQPALNPVLSRSELGRRILRKLSDRGE